MIANLKPYAEYKESGLPWLGQVPGHWEVKRLKNWVSINACTLSEDTLQDYKFDYLDIGSVTTGRLARRPSRMVFGTAPSRARRVLKPGDTIVSTVRTYLKAVYTVGSVESPLVASTGFAVLTPRSYSTARCLGYVAESEAFTNHVTAESVGIAYPAISETRLGNIAVTLPPPDEQAAIVRFLDWANGRLERAIRAKRKVIALLNEQKHAIIHRAVTRGLDPSVPLKDSGVPLLGHLPGHWAVKRPKQIGALLKGIGGTKEDSRSAGVPCVRYGELYTTHHFFIRRPKAFVEAARASAYTPIRYGDVLFAASGEKLDEIGKSAVNLLDVDAVCGGDTVVLRPRINLHAPFLGYAFDCRPSALQKAMMGRGTTVKHIYPDELKQLQIPLPPPEEQVAIVRFLDAELERFNTTISRLEREITLLREYRTRLVADVVTGKLDVRAAAAALPEEAPPGDAPVLSVSEEEALAEDEAFE